MSHQSWPCHPLGISWIISLPAFPFPGRRKRQIFHQRVEESLGSPVLALLSVWGCCRSRVVPFVPFPCPFFLFLVGCAALAALGSHSKHKHGAKLFPRTQTFLHPNYLLFPVGTQVILLAGFSPFLLLEHSQIAPGVIFNTACNLELLLLPDVNSPLSIHLCQELKL